MKILTGLGHTARYLAGAAVAGGVFLAQAAAIIIPVTLIVGIGMVSAIGAIVYFFGGFFVAIIAGVIVVTFVIFPSVLIGELTARRTYWPAAPIVALILVGALSAVGSVGWTALYSRPLNDAVLPALLSLASLALPTLAFGLITYPAGWAITSLAGRFPRIVGFLRRSAASLGRRFPRLAAIANRATAPVRRAYQLNLPPPPPQQP